MPSATINAPYPNRIVLQCDPFTGPFDSLALGQFDPRRDPHVWLNGVPLTITSFNFDSNNNRYLLYTAQPFLSGNTATDSALVVQIVEHMPAPPFRANNVVNAEPHTIPASGPFTITVNNSAEFGSDLGVSSSGSFVGPSGPPTLVTTLTTNVFDPFLALNATSPKVLSIDFNQETVSVIDVSGSTPTLTTNNFAFPALTNVNLQVPNTIPYIGTHFYLAGTSSGSDANVLHEYDDTTFTATGNKVTIVSSQTFPFYQAIAFTHGGTNYIVWHTTGSEGTASMGVAELTGYTVTGTVVVVPFAQADWMGSGIPIINSATGDIYFVFAYNSGGSYNALGATNWRVFRVNPFNGVSGGTFTDTSTYDFVADVDGNAGVGGFLDATNGTLAVICNRGAIKSFSLSSHTVTASTGSLATPAYFAQEEWPHDGSIPFSGPELIGTMGWTEDTLGLSTGSWFINSSSSNTGVSSTLLTKIDQRLTTTLSVSNVVDLSTVVSTLQANGLNQYPGMAFYGTKGWLFVTVAGVNTSLYVVGLPASTSGSGNPFFKVPANPTKGQYTVNDSGQYGFNSGDSSTNVFISYKFFASSIGGFGIIAAYETTGDEVLPPSASLGVVPAPPLTSGQAFTLFWNTFNVAKVRITGGSFDTGVISNPNPSGGSQSVPGGFTSTTTLTLAAFDSNGNPLVITPTPTFTVVIS